MIRTFLKSRKEWFVPFWSSMVLPCVATWALVTMILLTVSSMNPEPELDSGCLLVQGLLKLGATEDTKIFTTLLSNTFKSSNVSSSTDWNELTCLDNAGAGFWLPREGGMRGKRDDPPRTKGFPPNKELTLSETKSVGRRLLDDILKSKQNEQETACQFSARNENNFVDIASFDFIFCSDVVL